MSCCTRGPEASVSGFTARQSSTRGYCAPSPTNDPNVGEQTAQDTLAFCHNTNPMGGMAVYGENCGDTGCKPCQTLMQVKLNSIVNPNGRCFRGKDSADKEADPRTVFVHMKGCGCNGASALIMGAAMFGVAAALF